MWNEKDIDVYSSMVDRQVNALNLSPGYTVASLAQAIELHQS
jgi:hypothetical protein